MKKKLFGIFGILFVASAFMFILPLNDSGLVTIGMEAVEAAPTATTKLVVIQGWNPPEVGADELFNVSANAQTKTVEEDEILDKLGVTVLLDKSYAATSTDAKDNVRFVVTIVDPSSGTQYSRTVDEDHATVTTWTAVDSGTYWTIYTAWEIDDALYDNITLTSGNWTLTVNYEIYA